MPLQIGTILRHRYRIEGVLGQGGMGAVYRAVDINLGVDVAVKENLFTTEEYARQFRREATILASLRHPNLPRVTDHFVMEGEGQYLVMDFIQGEDLRERLEKQGALSERTCLPWFLDICDALAYLHSRKPPILHRDIKPGNIKITPDGRAMLVDFGLAKIVEKGARTSTGAKAMTPGFSPPEQYGSGRTDPRSDVYSVGATFYAALTASIPEDSLERAMGREKLTPIRKRNPQVSPALERVLARALAVKPSERYQSINELAAALTAATRSKSPTIVGSYPHLERTVIPQGRAEVDAVTGPPISQVIKPRLDPKWIVAGVAGVLILAGALYSLPGLLAGGARSTATGVSAPTSTIAASPLAATSTLEPLEPSPEPTEELAGSPIAVATAPGEATASLPAISTPTGGGVGQIAFASERSGSPQIYLVNIDGTGLKQLTQLDDGACQPAWSPNGGQIIFTSPCRGNQEQYRGSSLWLIDVDLMGTASEPMQLRTAPGGDFDPAWDPSGERIAFASIRDGRPQIYTMSLTGGDLANLSGDLAQDRQPVWSPTGAQLLYTSTRSGTTDIWLMLDTGEGEERFSRSGGLEDSHPDWSANGEFVLFQRRIGGVPRLIAARFDEGGQVDSRICPEGERSVQPMAEPRWSPDGNWIVFETWPDGSNHDVAIIRSGCSNYFLITTDPAADFDAAWRPTP